MSPSPQLQTYGLYAQIATSILTLLISVVSLLVAYKSNQSNMRATQNLKAADVFTECTKRYAELWQQIHDLDDCYLEMIHKSKIVKVGNDSASQRFDGKTADAVHRQGERALRRVWSLYDFEFIQWQKGFVPEDVFEQWAVAWYADLQGNKSYAGTRLRDSLAAYTGEVNKLDINHRFTAFLMTLTKLPDAKGIREVLNQYRRDESA